MAIYNMSESSDRIIKPARGMGSNYDQHVRPIKTHIGDEKEKEEILEPVSPAGQYYSSSVLSVSIIAVLESEIPIQSDLSFVMTLLNDIFLPISPRFSSIMVQDGNGGKQWKKVDIRLEEHVKFPVFQNGLSMESYDDIFQDYLTEIALDQLPKNKPLWEVHVFKYPTSNAPATVIFKLHHALGDGYSLMGALFTCLQRADNPSLPLTFPMYKQKSSVPAAGQNGAADVLWKNTSVFGNVLSALVNTAKDFTLSLLSSSTVLEDHLSPIRSGKRGILEFQPVVISSLTFSLDKIKQIKDKLGGTINDVTTGIIFYGIRLYMEAVRKGSSNARSTALVLLNTRMIESYNYQTVEEMTKTDSKSPWGNHFGFIHTSIPETLDANTENPLKFVWEAKKTIQKKKNSLSAYLTGHLLEFMRKYRGVEKTSEYIYGTISNASTVITNMLGPIEKMSLANHPVKGFYFMVTNVPLDTAITIVSYMGQLRVSVGAQKETINHKLFNKSLEMAYEKIFKAAINISSS